MTICRVCSLARAAALHDELGDTHAQLRASPEGGWNLTPMPGGAGELHVASGSSAARTGRAERRRVRPRTAGPAPLSQSPWGASGCAPPNGSSGITQTTGSGSKAMACRTPQVSCSERFLRAVELEASPGSNHRQRHEPRNPLPPGPIERGPSHLHRGDAPAPLNAPVILVPAIPLLCRPKILVTRARPAPYNPTILFHRLANSTRSFDVMSRAIASRLRIAVFGKIRGLSARAAVSLSLESARTCWAAGTGQT